MLYLVFYLATWYGAYMPKLVVLIPAYNEAATIRKVIKSIPQKILGCLVSVVVVNDGSNDGTAALAATQGAHVVSHPTNYGVGRSFQTGIEEALRLGADYLVNIDADGQFTAKDIPLILAPVLKGEADFVAGDRFTADAKGKRLRPQNMPKEKYWGNQMMARIISIITGERFYDVSSGFRAYSRRTLLALNLTGTFTYTQESFIDLVTKGFRTKNVPVSVKYFTDRKSRVANNLFKYGARTLKIIFRAFRDYRPLMFFTYLSLLPLVVALGCTIFVTIHYAQTGEFSPYKYLGFIAIYFSAVTLLLWILGFLADMFTRVRLTQEKILFYEKERVFAKSKK